MNDTLRLVIANVFSGVGIFMKSKRKLALAE